jgi:hypothetical protein
LYSLLFWKIKLFFIRNYSNKDCDLPSGVLAFFSDEDAEEYVKKMLCTKKVDKMEGEEDDEQEENENPQEEKQTERQIFKRFLKAVFKGN